MPFLAPLFGRQNIRPKGNYSKTISANENIRVRLEKRKNSVFRGSRPAAVHKLVGSARRGVASSRELAIDVINNTPV